MYSKYIPIINGYIRLFWYIFIFSVLPKGNIAVIISLFMMENIIESVGVRGAVLPHSF